MSDQSIGVSTLVDVDNLRTWISRVKFSSLPIFWSNLRNKNMNDQKSHQKMLWFARFCEMCHRSMQFQSGNLGATLVISKPGEFGVLSP